MNTFLNESLLDFSAFVTGKTSCFNVGNSWLVPYTTNSATNGANFAACFNGAAAAIKNTGTHDQTIVMQCSHSVITNSCTAPLILTLGFQNNNGCLFQNFSAFGADFCIPPVIQKNYASPHWIYIVPSSYGLLPAQNNRLNPYPCNQAFPFCNDKNNNSIQNDLWRFTVQNAFSNENTIFQPGASYIRMVEGEITSESTAGANYYAQGVTSELVYTSGSPEGQNRLVTVRDASNNVSSGSWGLFQVIERNAPGKPLVVSQSPSSAALGSTGNVTLTWINNNVTATQPKFTEPTGIATITGSPTSSISVTVNSGTLFPPFESGQYIADANGAIPANTTITSVSGSNPYTLGLSNPTTSNQSSDGVFTWPYVMWAGNLSSADLSGATSVSWTTPPVCSGGSCTLSVSVTWASQADPFQRVTVSNGQVVAPQLMGMMFQLTGSSGCSNSPQCGDSTLTLSTDTNPAATTCSGNGPTYLTHTAAPFTLCLTDPNANWVAGDYFNIGGATDKPLVGTGCAGGAPFTVRSPTTATVTLCGNKSSFTNQLIRSLDVAVRHVLGTPCPGGSNFCETANSASHAALEMTDAPQWIASATPATAAPGDTSVRVRLIQGVATTGALPHGVAWTSALNCNTITSCANILNFAGNYSAVDGNCTTNGSTTSTNNPQGGGCIDVLSFTMTTPAECSGITAPCGVAVISLDPHTMDGANNVILDRMFIHGRDTTVGCPAGTVACPLATTQYGPAKTPVRVAFNNRGNWSSTVTYNILDQVTYTDGKVYVEYSKPTSINQIPPSTPSVWSPNLPPCGNGQGAAPPRTPLASINLPFFGNVAGNTADSGLCAYTVNKGGGEWPVFWSGGGAVDVNSGATMNGTNNAIIDSYFDEMHTATSDYNDISWKAANGFLKFDNNHLGNATENIFSGGAGDSSASPWNGYEIEIRQNYAPSEPQYQQAGIDTMGYMPGSFNSASCASTTATTFSRCDQQCFGTTRPGCQQWVIKNKFEFKIGRRMWLEGNLGDGGWTGTAEFPQLAQLVEFDPRGGQQGSVLSPEEDETLINNAGINLWGGFLTTNSDPQCFVNSDLVGYTDPQCAEKAPWPNTNGPWNVRVNVINNLITRLTSRDEGTVEEVGNQGVYYASQIGNGDGRDVLVQHNTNVPQAGKDYANSSLDYLGYASPQNGIVHGQYFNEQIGQRTFPAIPQQSFTHNNWWLDNVFYCAPNGQGLGDGIQSIYDVGLPQPITGALYDPNIGTYNYAGRFSGNINYLPSDGHCGGPAASVEDNNPANPQSWAANPPNMGTNTDSGLRILSTNIFKSWQISTADELLGQDPTLVDANNDTHYNASLWEGPTLHTGVNCDTGATNTSSVNTAIFGAHATTGVCAPVLVNALQEPFGVKLGVYGTPALTITTNSVPDGEQNLAYTANISAQGGTPPYTYTIPATGALATGLSCTTGCSSSTSGAAIISGTPSCTTYPCTASFTASVKDAANSITSSGTLSMTVYAALVFPAQTPSTGTINTDYSYTLQTSGGRPTLTYSVTSGAMPACGSGTLDGLCLSVSSGTISGNAANITNPLTDTSTYRVCDSLNVCQSQALTVKINSNLGITPPNCPNGAVNVAYTCNLSASGGAAPYTWSISSGALCAGLALGSSNTLTNSITGTVTTPQSCTFSVQIQDTNGVTANTGSITINIQSAINQIVVVCSVCTGVSHFLPNATIGQSYGPYTITATGGTPPYTFSISAGGMPQGLTLSSAGVISGVPTKIQSGVTPTIKATDTVGDIPGTLRVDINVNGLNGAFFSGGVLKGGKIK